MLSDKNIYEIWLQQTLGYGNAKAATVYRMFESAEAFYNAGYKEWVFCGCFTKRELNAFNTLPFARAIEIFKQCEESGISIVSLWDDFYPSLLREIHNPPCLLYYKGELPGDDELFISIVGTRNPSVAGLKIAQKLSDDLARKGVVIVSGGALGIDSAAHRGAIMSNGKSVCVLGCGLNSSYLSSNKTLRDSVILNGALISEYPPEMMPEKYTFPMRNRIISGLSAGTLVVEAGEKSGALITANLALEQGRDVFAVPGNSLVQSCKGVNELIKLGAIPVTEAGDILEQYVYDDGRRKNLYFTLPVPEYSEEKSVNIQNRVDIESKKDKIKTEDKKEKRSSIDIDTADVSDDAKTVYKILENGQKNIDEICALCKLPIFTVQGALTELEIENLIITSAGRMYSINA